MIPNHHYGMTLPLSNEIDKIKYRQTGEDFYSKIVRIAGSLKDTPQHFEEFKDTLRTMRFLPAGRVQNAMGATRMTTAYNCFVSGTIEDDLSDILDNAKEAGLTMKKGGGIGYDFSNIRPRGDHIVSLDSKASGPVSFMGIFDAVCQTIASSGHRRGAQMGVLRIDHPDIMEFITAKSNADQLTGFNVSVGVTDEFMRCLKEQRPFALVYKGKTYDEIDPVALWDTIMRNTWDWAEPGVLFIDTINKMNNLWYCESIAATNPCGEQPLPPYGACLLGSFNLVKYVVDGQFDFGKLTGDIYNVVRAMDNVVDRTIYPLEKQKEEAKNKRRMGLGVTGLANASELCGYPYGTQECLDFTAKILETIRDYTYAASSDLALEKGSFPLYDAERYLQGKFIKTLSGWVQEKIKLQGIRNSHLTSIAPTGTISLTADNVSSGIEPPFAHFYDRTIQQFDGHQVERVEDYAYHQGVLGKTANEISAQEHLDMLALVSKYVDSAVSKTCNVGDNVNYDTFKELYRQAWELGCKGITTFRASGKRFGILNEVKDEVTPKAEACFIDPSTGQKQCD
jgi:ribonucleoside-diphosphate reductase alpha chain